MSVHFMSMLGTSLYQPVLYEGNEKKDEYIQVALIRKFYEEIKVDGRVTIFITDKACKANWEDRVFSGEDENRSKKWSDYPYHAGMMKKGLKSTLYDEFPDLIDVINVVGIPDGKNENEQRETFRMLFDELKDEEEIYFDLTHSFRSIPVLAVTMLNYAKSMKGIKVKGIYYGAYEARDNVTCPIFDLSLYDQIMEWSYAADSYVRFGDVKKIKEMYKGFSRRNRGKIKENLGKVVGCMEMLSDALLTCRGKDMLATGVTAGEARKTSIKNAYEWFRDNLNQVTNDVIPELMFLYPLIQRVSQDFSIFDKKSNFEIGISSIDWCVKNGLVQQGYTAMEETIKTYLCDQYGIDDSTEKTRDLWIGSIINSHTHEKKKLSREKRNLKVEKVLDWINGKDKLNEEERDALRFIYLTIPEEFIDFSQKVKDMRNDLNHFGFKSKPTPADTLRKNLEKDCRKFHELVENRMKNDRFNILLKEYQRLSHEIPMDSKELPNVKSVVKSIGNIDKDRISEIAVMYIPVINDMLSGKPDDEMIAMAVHKLMEMIDEMNVVSDVDEHVVHMDYEQLMSIVDGVKKQIG